MSFLRSVIGIVWSSLRPEYQVTPDFIKRSTRGKYCSISDGLDGMSVCEKIGGDLLFSCQDAKLAFLS